MNTVVPHQRDFAAALLNPDLPCPAGLTAWNGSDPARRFAVYRNNVVSSLVTALVDTFPVVQALVGEEFFRAMAGVFVRESPPPSPILAHYGERFPEFVAGFAPAQSVPYLADVARLEMARVRAYHAADADPIAPEALAQAMSQPEQVPQLRGHLHPSLAVLRSAHAIVSLWAAHQGEQDVAAVDPFEPEDALVLRSALDVQLVLLPPGAATFIHALADGLPLGAAAQRSMDEYAAFDVTPTLALLLQLGALIALHPALHPQGDPA